MAPETKKQTIDPTHMDEAKKYFLGALQSLSPINKVFLIANLILNLALRIIPAKIGNVLGVRSNKAFKLKQITTRNPQIFEGTYLTPRNESNVFIIKGKDGTLFLRSPPPAEPNIVRAICEEGKPSAILASMAHDSYADKWKELFPEAKVIAQRADIPLVNNRVKVDIALEDAGELLKNFYVFKTLSTAKFTKSEDAVLLLEMEGGKVGAAIGCGFVHRPVSILNPFDWIHYISGEYGLGALRMFSLVFNKDIPETRKFWDELSRTPNLSALFFLHGKPLIADDVPERMRKVGRLTGWTFA